MVDRKNIQDIYPLTPMQEGMHFQANIDSGSSAYFQQMTLQIEGDLDPALLERSWNLLIARHDILRTVFIQGGGSRPMQVVLRERMVKLVREDLSVLEDEQAVARIEEIAELERHTPFDLARDPLLRLHLFQRTAGRWTLLYSFHHILMDGWCFPILMGELYELYASLLENRPPNLPPPQPFSRYVKWLERRSPEEDLAWWRGELLGLESPVSLPSANGRTVVQGEYQLARHTVELSEQTTRRLRDLAVSNSVTLSTLVRALWAVFLRGHGVEEDVVFGTTLSGRPAEVVGVERMVGLFINTVPVRVRLEKDELFTDFLTRLQQHSLELDSHQHVSLAEIQGASALKRDLIQHLLIFENVPEKGDHGEAWFLPGVKALDSTTFEQTHYDLEVTVFPRSQLSVRFAYNLNRYTREEMEHFGERFRTLVQSILEHPDGRVSELELLPESERNMLLTRFNPPMPEERTPMSLLEMFARQVELHRDDTALVFRHKQLSYGELDRLSDRVAGHLQSVSGVMAGDHVALLLERSEWLPVCMLGVLKAGAAWVPMDPDYPHERMTAILERAKVQHILVGDSSFWRDRFDRTDLDWIGLNGLAEVEAPPQRLTPAPDALAYVTFTSGSTGEPKGVMVTQANVASFARNLIDRFGMEPGDVLYAVTTNTFDISVLELLCSLLNGLTVVIAAKEATSEATRILEELARHDVTVLQMTPSHLSMIVEGLAMLPDLRVLLVGGEALPDELHDSLCTLRGKSVFNVYGPTETTIWSSAKRLREGERTIGTPLNGETLHILGWNGLLAPTGVSGEICIGGSGVSQGYIGQPELTGERFIDNLPQNGGRLYRTGDLGRWLSTGEVEYLGRIDNQVKVRGFRIEPGEIEAHIARMEGVLETAVVSIPDEDGMASLVAFYTGLSSHEERRFREELKAFLPGYMIPTRFVYLEQMPLTHSGKVDRKALASSDRVSKASVRTFDLPRTELEWKIIRVWEEVLNQPKIGIHDSFLEIGGHSLKAMQIVAKLRKDAGVTVSVGELLEAGTVAALADTIRHAGDSTYRSIPRLTGKGPSPLSHSQRRLWVLEKLGEQDRSAYILPGVLHVSGDLDKGALLQAFVTLVERHEALRTRFVEVDGEPRQEVLGQVEFQLSEVDLTHETGLEQLALRQIEETFTQPFDLSHAPLFDVTLYRLAEHEWLLLTRMHHIITDAGSMSILERELVECYRAFRSGQSPALPELTVRYRDFAQWQAKLLDKARSGREREYWLATLKDHVTLDLPADHPRPPTQTIHGDTVQLELDESTLKGLVELGLGSHVSLFTTLMAVTSLFLKQLSGERDILLGTPVSGREHPDLDGVVGFFANTLPLRTRFEGISNFRELLDHTGTMVRSAMDHALYPFDRLVDDLDLARDLSRPPLLSVMLSLEEEEEDTLLPGVESRRVALTSTISRFDLTFEAVRRDGILRLGLNYSTALFERGTVERWAGWYRRLIQAVVASPETPLAGLELLSQEERESLLTIGQGEPHPHSAERNLVSLFEACVENNRERPAVKSGKGVVTCGELDDSANRLAQMLLVQGLERGEVVASLHTRSLEAVIAMLGILKAGGSVLPLKPGDPSERVRDMVRETGCRILLATEAHRAEAESLGVKEVFCPPEWAGAESVQPKLNLTGSDLAYLIYTSGSTGAPKGVLVEHGGFCNMILDQIRQFEVRETDRVLQFAPLTFDASMSEMFMALLSGALLVPVGEADVADSAEFARFLGESGITVATLPPSYLTLLPREAMTGLRVLITAGEAPILADVEYYRTRLRYFNAYGPTEASVCATIQEVHPELPLGQGVPMGKAIANMRLYLMDDELNPVGVGIPGEIFLAGPGLARGYLNRPDETARRFLPDPFRPNGHIYRTGDRAKRKSDGSLIYLGRLDGQIKVRGQRVELGEIRHHLLALPRVRDAALLPYPEKGPYVGITAYLSGIRERNQAELRALLRDRLPESMIPTRFAILDELPLTAHGKLDRSRLPETAEETPATRVDTPLSPLQKRVLEVWRRVPGLEKVGLYDSFFEAGGNSLSAIQLATQLSDALNRKINVRTLFLHQSIEALSQYLESESEPTESKVAPLIKASAGVVPTTVEVVEEPLLQLFRTGRLDGVDAASVGYFTEEMLTATGMSREEFLDKAGNEPILSNIISSKHGRIAFFTLPLFTADLYRDRESLLEMLSSTLALAGEMGARMVSLTGLIPSATGYGADLVKMGEKYPVWPAVTTGHATTAATVLLAIDRILQETGRSMEGETLGLVGLGSVGTSMFRLVLSTLPHPKRLILCDLESQKMHLEALCTEARQHLNFVGKIEIVYSKSHIPDAFYDSSVVVGATNIPDILSVHQLHPGTLVVDDSGPYCFSVQDAIERLQERGDVLFTEAGGLCQQEPFGVQAWLPPFLRRWLEENGITPYEGFDPHQITGCVLSSLLTVREENLAPTVGQPDVEACRGHFAALRKWGMTSPPLHFGDFRIDASQIDRFRKNQISQGWGGRKPVHQ